MSIVEEMRKALTFIKNNIDIYDMHSDGRTMVRQVTAETKKNKEELFKNHRFKKDVLPRIESWLQVLNSDNEKLIHWLWSIAGFSGLMGFALAGIQDDPERFYDIYALSMMVPPPEYPDEQNARKQQMREKRIIRDKMDPLDSKYFCLNCGKFAHEYDQKNNHIHTKDEVCICGGVTGPQRLMKEQISKYRTELADKKKHEKARKAKKRRLHGTT